MPPKADMAAASCNQFPGFFYIPVLSRLARRFPSVTTSSVSWGEGQRAMIKMMPGSYFSEKLSCMPRPRAPPASDWLKRVTWSVVAARESGRLGALSTHYCPEQNLGCYKEWTVGCVCYSCRRLEPAFRYFMLPSNSHLLVPSHPSSPPTTSVPMIHQDSQAPQLSLLFLSKTSIFPEKGSKQPSLKVINMTM